MQLEINNYKITLGPRALAHVETMKSPYFEDAAKVYAQNELERWCAGGKVGPDVTISGPERFVPRYNEIGLPVMPKAGAGGVAGPVDLPASGKPLPVASAAPADPEWPRFVLGSRYAGMCVQHEHDKATWYDERGISCPARSSHFDKRGMIPAGGGRLLLTRAEAAKWLRANNHAKVADELERQAHPAHGLQVWRSKGTGRLFLVRGNHVWDRLDSSREWREMGWPWTSESEALCDRLTGPEAEAASKEARAQGVI